LNPGVLKEKELAEARAVFEKHGLSVATEQRKRREKAYDKSITAKSRTSKLTSGSKRGTDGKFEGMMQFGDNDFTKKGLNKGKQMWQCVVCKKRTS
jgi:hypothetical protein